jgi:hypothetical protein
MCQEPGGLRLRRNRSSKHHLKRAEASERLSTGLELRSLARPHTRNAAARTVEQPQTWEVHAGVRWCVRSAGDNAARPVTMPRSWAKVGVNILLPGKIGCATPRQSPAWQSALPRSADFNLLRPRTQGTAAPHDPAAFGSCGASESRRTRQARRGPAGVRHREGLDTDEAQSCARPRSDSR